MYLKWMSSPERNLQNPGKTSLRYRIRQNETVQGFAENISNLFYSCGHKPLTTMTIAAVSTLAQLGGRIIRRHHGSEKI